MSGGRYFTCSVCRELCNDVERDFGIGAYEFWGAPGTDSNIQRVSQCCDGEVWTPEKVAEVLAEEEEEVVDE